MSLRQKKGTKFTYEYLQFALELQPGTSPNIFCYKLQAARTTLAFSWKFPRLPRTTSRAVLHPALSWAFASRSAAAAIKNRGPTAKKINQSDVAQRRADAVKTRPHHKKKKSEVAQRSPDATKKEKERPHHYKKKHRSPRFCACGRSVCAP